MPAFSRRCDDGAGYVRFFQQQSQRQGAARGRENFADSFFGRAGSSSVVAGFHATIFCVRVFRWRSTSRAVEVAAAHEFFGGGFVYCARRRGRGVAGAVNLPKKREFGLFLDPLSHAVAEIAKIGAAGIGERIFAVVTKLNFGRKHGAKCFADRREIIAADPVAEFDELRRQRGKRNPSASAISFMRGMSGARSDSERPTPIIARLPKGTTTRRPTRGSPSSDAGTA